MPIISSKVVADIKSPFSRFLELPAMSHASRSAHIADLIDDLADLYLAQVADLREFAQATEAGEGTMHLEDALRHREISPGCPLPAVRAGRLLSGPDSGGRSQRARSPRG
jgi:hypothetical protein